MNVLFVSISSISSIAGHSISVDLIHEFLRHGHKVYVVSSIEKRENKETHLIEESGCQILRVKIGNNKRTNIIRKGITTLTMPGKYIKAIKKYFSDVKFDLVMYPTPPVTAVNVVNFIKKRDGARSYLLLKDIFPQNAVDIGMMTKRGIKGFIYRHFRKKEKRLYEISDRIGCMSQANVDYVLKHNPEVSADKVEICPNSIEICPQTLTDEERYAIRAKYGIPQDKKVFVYGGNLGRPQGIPFIIECLKEQQKNADAYFLIVGDGTEYGKLKEYFSEANPTNMKLMKRIPKEDYDRLVAACDVGLIFLDHRFTIPNFPSRLLGYMQARLPVLASTDTNTDIGKTIVEGGFGWWCESNDVAAFGEQVDAALAADLKTVGESGMAYLYDHYSVDSSYAVIQNFFERSINENCCK